MRPRSSSQTVADLGERRLIREIIAPLAGHPDHGLGIGDDAAVLELPAGHDVVASTDKIPEDLLALSFGLMDASHHGRYLAEVNLSDLGAMGARPLGLLACLAFPDDFELAYLRDFLSGFVDAGRRWGAPLLGGDTKWASTSALSATAIGAVPSGQALARRGARSGDDLFVSGSIGGFGAALAYFADAGKRTDLLDHGHEEWLRKRLVTPRARVDLGMKLRATGACTACMDISDGFGQSIRELTEASAACVVIEAAQLPIHPAVHAVARVLGVDPLELVFGIGLDLELLGAISPEHPGAADVAEDVTVIGTFTESGESSVRLPGGEVVSLTADGWQHFTGPALSYVQTRPRGAP